MNSNAEELDNRGVKKGLGTGNEITKRHVYRDTQRRKDKRAHELNRFRSKSDTHVAHMPLLDAYTKSNGSIMALWSLLHQSTDDDLQVCLPRILQQTPVLATLTRLMTGEDAEQGSLAAACIEIITGARTECALGCAHDLIVRHHFLQIAYAHISEFTSITMTCWRIVANITSLCGEARDTVLNSPLFKGGPNAPFFKCIASGDIRYQSVALLIICGMIETGYNLPPMAFIYAVWPYLLRTLRELAPPEMRTIEVSDDLEFLLSALCYFSEQYDKAEDFTRMLRHPDAGHVTFMVQLIPRCNNGIEGCVNKRRIARYINAVGELGGFYKELIEAGCIDVMIRLMQDGNALLQREGIVWIGNAAVESLDVIELLLHRNAYDPIINTIRRNAKSDLMKQCMFALCSPCATARIIAVSQPAEAERAYGLLAHFVNDKRIIKLTVPYVDVTGGEQTSIDILTLWRDLLKWNTPYITPLLEEVGALDKVDTLLGTNFTPIYTLAYEIDTMVHNHTSGGADMDLDIESGFIAPGVYQGGYTF